VTLNSFLAITAALLSATLACAVVLLKRRSVVGWSFFAGMAILAADSALGGAQSWPSSSAGVAHAESILLIKSFLPGIWLLFGVTYSRGNYRYFLSKWKYILAAAFLLPIGLAVGFQGHLVLLASAAGSDGALALHFSRAAVALNVTLLLATVLILMNLEQTFRSAIGTMRWRVKFVILGLAVVFGARVYSLSDAILFSFPNPAMATIEDAALVVGGIFMVIAYLRRGFAELDVYPSHAFFQSSVTVLLAGGYLFFVGIFAQAVVLVAGRSFRTAFPTWKHRSTSAPPR
jgi:hypothetical protein